MTDTAEEKIAELEAVIVVAEDALETMRTFVNVWIAQGEEEGMLLVTAEWMHTLSFKLELAIAATKHRRV